MQEKIIDLFKVAEIELTYHSLPEQVNRPVIRDSKSCYDIFLANWDTNKLELQEQFKVMLLNRRHQCLGIVEIGTGSTTACIVDTRLIFAAAIKANSLSIAVAHNHPSGCLEPSNADFRLTENIIGAGKLLDISVLDHLIITKHGYKSFADEGFILI